ncbi:MAG TPA: hypothetical protein VGG66_04745, partial [Rhizomicrobium sp.]
MASPSSALLALAVLISAAPALAQTQSAPAAPAPTQSRQTNWWSEPGNDSGPTRIVWAAHKNPETPYTGPNKP